jgi:hypothetical protein
MWEGFNISKNNHTEQIACMSWNFANGIPFHYLSGFIAKCVIK